MTVLLYAQFINCDHYDAVLSTCLCCDQSFEKLRPHFQPLNHVTVNVLPLHLSPVFVSALNLINGLLDPFAVTDINRSVISQERLKAVHM